MIKKAEKLYNIDLNRSFIIGDRTVDIKTGENAKIKTVLVKTGYAEMIENLIVIQIIIFLILMRLFLKF